MAFFTSVLFNKYNIYIEIHLVYIYTIFMKTVQETLCTCLTFLYVKLMWIINQQLYSENCNSVVSLKLLYSEIV